eukprot:TRINITY_DN1019_c7_g1_i2.p1 TRINITY_DN1019_c7_g1~~TRINITY_DN1019_c7_g1_i2.p1  ORF type:complete len:242 (+),score=62.07 TRINITY_DN1019_c7_g1_i2:129-854(+)
MVETHIPLFERVMKQFPASSTTSEASDPTPETTSAPASVKEVTPVHLPKAAPTVVQVNKPKIREASPEHLERPCNHNKWTKLAKKRGKLVLVCLVCDTMWKTFPELHEKCSSFHAGHCERGENCPHPHVYARSARKSTKLAVEKEQQQQLQIQLAAQRELQQRQAQQQQQLQLGLQRQMLRQQQVHPQLYQQAQVILPFQLAPQQLAQVQVLVAPQHPIEPFPITGTPQLGTPQLATVFRS